MVAGPCKKARPRTVKKKKNSRCQTDGTKRFNNAEQMRAVSPAYCLPLGQIVPIRNNPLLAVRVVVPLLFFSARPLLVEVCYQY